jgi:hypothetical protein
MPFIIYLEVIYFSKEIVYTRRPWSGYSWEYIYRPPPSALLAIVVRAVAGQNFSIKQKNK